MSKKTSKYVGFTNEQLIEKIEKLEKERYGLVWEDKEEDVAKQCETELPLLSEDTTREIISDKTQPYNFIIEGDNYHSLYTLNFTHKKKIDVIYIDPPYNTGKKNEWKYNDHWIDENDSYRHSKWLSFMNKRLRLAKNLLKDTGVIFISIDDNELAPLKMLCDKIFGTDNFVSTIVWQKKTGASDAKGIATITEYILCYIKNKLHVSTVFTRNQDSYDINRYKYKDNYYRERGPYYIDNLDRGGLQYSDSLNFGITCPDGTLTFPNGRKDYKNDGWIWKWSAKKIQWAIENDFIEIKKSKKKKSGWAVYYKNYQFVDNENYILEKSGPHKNLIFDVLNTNATFDIKNIFDNEVVFKYSKPIKLISKILKFINIKPATILDFFAGSGTTGHAVMELNKEDGGNRQFILCTNNENNICEEVTYPRIKKVIEGYADKEGIPGNVKYFRQVFVPNVLNDEDKRTLVAHSTELLCMAEGTFECIDIRSGDFQSPPNEHSYSLPNKNTFAIFHNHENQTAIIYDEDSISECVSYLNKNNNNYSQTVIYVFSYGVSYDEQDFTDLQMPFKVKPIPEAILNVYRKIGKQVRKK